MNSIVKLIFLIVVLLFSMDTIAQRQVRYQRRKARLEQRIQQDERNGKISAQEQEEIAERERKLNRTNRKAVRNGNISTHEQNKMNRRLRKVRRETREAEKH
jgi:uncharacterized protein HemX